MSCSIYAGPAIQEIDGSPCGLYGTMFEQPQRQLKVSATHAGAPRAHPPLGMVVLVLVQYLLQGSRRRDKSET